MGHYKDSRGIDCFEPDDTEDVMYLSCSWMEPTTTLSTLLHYAERKWPDGWKDLAIAAEYIHTDCLYYDRYDPGDYTNYLKITRIKKGT